MPGRSGMWGIAFMAVALGLTVHGTLLSVRARRWRARAVATRALIVDNAPHLTAHRRTMWQPIIEYYAGGSRVHTLVPNLELRRALPLGGLIDVLYDPDDPAHARPADAQTVGSTLVVGLFALALFFIIIAA